MSGRRIFGLFENKFCGVFKVVTTKQFTYFGLGFVDGPCKAGDDDAGFSANASKSLRTADDCFRAELNSEFCNCLADV